MTHKVALHPVFCETLYNGLVFVFANLYLATMTFSELTSFQILTCCFSLVCHNVILYSSQCDDINCKLQALPLTCAGVTTHVKQSWAPVSPCLSDSGHRRRGLPEARLSQHRKFHRLTSCCWVCFDIFSTWRVHLNLKAIQEIRSKTLTHNPIRKVLTWPKKSFLQHCDIKYMKCILMRVNTYLVNVAQNNPSRWQQTKGKDRGEFPIVTVVCVRSDSRFAKKPWQELLWADKPSHTHTCTGDPHTSLLLTLKSQCNTIAVTVQKFLSNAIIQHIIMYNWDSRPTYKHPTGAYNSHT